MLKLWMHSEKPQSPVWGFLLFGVYSDSHFKVCTQFNSPLLSVNLPCSYPYPKLSNRP